MANERCPGQTAAGTPCGNRPLKQADSDGVRRCWRHSIEPARIERQKASDEDRRVSAIEGERRHKAARRVEERARALGLISGVPARKGARGRRPLAPGVSTLAEGPLGAHFEHPEGFPEVVEAETVADRLGAFDLQTAEGRSKYRHALVEAKAAGLIDARELEAFLRAARDQEKDKAAQRALGTCRVVFGLIRDRGDAEDYKDAQALAEEMA